MKTNQWFWKPVQTVLITALVLFVLVGCPSMFGIGGGAGGESGEAERVASAV